MYKVVSIKTHLQDSYIKHLYEPLVLMCELDDKNITHGTWSCDEKSVMEDSGHTAHTRGKTQTLAIETLLSNDEQHNYSFNVDRVSTSTRVYNGRYYSFSCYV